PARPIIATAEANAQAGTHASAHAGAARAARQGHHRKAPRPAPATRGARARKKNRAAAALDEKLATAARYEPAADRPVVGTTAYSVPSVLLRPSAAAFASSAASCACSAASAAFSAASARSSRPVISSAPCTWPAICALASAAA